MFISILSTARSACYQNTPFCYKRRAKICSRQKQQKAYILYYIILYYIIIVTSTTSTLSYLPSGRKVNYFRVPLYSLFSFFSTGVGLVEKTGNTGSAGKVAYTIMNKNKELQQKFCYQRFVAKIDFLKNLALQGLDIKGESRVTSGRVAFGSAGRMTHETI